MHLLRAHCDIGMSSPFFGPFGRHVGISLIKGQAQQGKYLIICRNILDQAKGQAQQGKHLIIGLHVKFGPKMLSFDQLVPLYLFF